METAQVEIARLFSELGILGGALAVAVAIGAVVSIGAYCAAFLSVAWSWAPFALGRTHAGLPGGAGRPQRMRELRAAALGPAALFAGLWGLAFHVDGLMVAALFGVLASNLLASSRWAGRAFHVATFALILWLGSFIPPEVVASELERGAVAVFAVGCVTHTLNHFGTSHLLAEKLAASGEFRSG